MIRVESYSQETSKNDISEQTVPPIEMTGIPSAPEILGIGYTLDKKYPNQISYYFRNS